MCVLHVTDMIGLRRCLLFYRFKECRRRLCHVRAVHATNQVASQGRETKAVGNIPSTNVWSHFPGKGVCSS